MWHKGVASRVASGRSAARKSALFEGAISIAWQHAGVRPWAGGASAITCNFIPIYCRGLVVFSAANFSHLRPDRKLDAAVQETDKPNSIIDLYYAR